MLRFLYSEGREWLVSSIVKSYGSKKMRDETRLKNETRWGLGLAEAPWSFVLFLFCFPVATSQLCDYLDHNDGYM